MEKIFCTCCDSELVVTHQGRYPDPAEHASDPNGVPSLKDGYQCENKDCIAHAAKTIWLLDGDWFTGERPPEIERDVLLDCLKKKYGTRYAVNSFSFHYSRGQDIIKKKTRTIRIFKLMIKIAPKELGWKHPMEKRYFPHPWKKVVSFWKHSTHGWLLVIPFWKMARYSVRSFKQDYSKWEKDRNKYAKEDACEKAFGIRFGAKDSRFYAKIASLWIQIFHLKKVKVLKEA